MKCITQGPDNANGDHSANSHLPHIHHVITHAFVPGFLVMPWFSAVLSGSICHVCKVHSTREVALMHNKGIQDLSTFSSTFRSNGFGYPENKVP